MDISTDIPWIWIWIGFFISTASLATGTLLNMIIKNITRVVNIFNFFQLFVSLLQKKGGPDPLPPGTASGHNNQARYFQ